MWVVDDDLASARGQTQRVCRRGLMQQPRRALLDVAREVALHRPLVCGDERIRLGAGEERAPGVLGVEQEAAPGGVEILEREARRRVAQRRQRGEPLGRKQRGLRGAHGDGLGHR